MQQGGGEWQPLQAIMPPPAAPQAALGFSGLHTGHGEEPAVTAYIHPHCRSDGGLEAGLGVPVHGSMQSMVQELLQRNAELLQRL